MRDVVAILDVRLLEGSEVNRDFIDKAVGGKRLRGEGLTPGCKALVVTRDMMVYTSAISTHTLARRMIHPQQSARAWDAET